MRRPDFDVFRGRRLLGACLLLTLALSTVAIVDPDLAWHLSAARGLLRTGAFARADFLSWTLAGKPWVDFEWGSEILFYGLARLGDSVALWLFRSASFFALALGFLGFLRALKIPRTWKALAVPAFAAGLFPLYGMRPEIFSFALFLLQFYLLERRRREGRPVSVARWAWMHAGLYAVWANLHAGFVAGLLLCACYGFGELFSRPEDAVPPSLLAAAAGVAGTLVNPYGVRIYAVLLEHGRQIGSLRQLIEEWKAPQFFQPYLTGYWLIVVFSFGGLLWATVRGAPLPPEHVAVVAAFALFGSRSVRTTSYFMLTVFPLGLRAWATLRPSRRLRRILALSAVALFPVVVWRGFLLGDHRRFLGWPAPVERQGPARAIAFLRRESRTLSPLPLYNPYNWGGYLGYALSPEYKVFIDGRYIFADLLSEVDAAQRSPAAFRSFVDAEGADLAVVANDGFMARPQTNRPGEGPRPYLVYAWPRVDWALVYWDDESVVLVRRARVPKGWLKKNEYRCLRPHDLHQLGLYVVAGITPLKDVAAEIARYRSEIGDPYEVAQLTGWYESFRKGLAPPARRR